MHDWFKKEEDDEQVDLNKWELKKPELPVWDGYEHWGPQARMAMNLPPYPPCYFKVDYL